MLKNSISPMNSVSSKKILVVTEGLKDEPTVFRKLSEIFGLASNVEIVPYGTNIHQLIAALEKEVDLEDVDIQLLLREIARKSSKAQSEIEKLNDTYTDKIFIFDIEIQDPNYYENETKILKLLEAMNDSTSDLGKLFINYPMWESYFIRNPAILYFENFSKRGAFKEYAHKSVEWRLYNKNKLDDNSYKSLLKAQATRYEAVLRREYDADSGLDLFRLQTENIKENKIAIINTSVLFFVDYLGKEKVLKAI